MQLTAKHNAEPQDVLIYALSIAREGGMGQAQSPLFYVSKAFDILHRTTD